MKKNLMEIAMSLILLLGSASGIAMAFDGPPERGGKMEPPSEAIEVCKDKSEGAAVTITTPRGDTIKATCQQVNGQLVAVPDGGFRGRGMPSGRSLDGQ